MASHSCQLPVGDLTGLSQASGAYLTTLATRHEMRAAVSPQTKITMFFRVGRCFMRGEMGDPSVASVPLCLDPSWPTTVDDVALMRVAGEDRACGSPLAHQTAAIRRRRTISRVSGGLCVTMVLKGADKRRVLFAQNRMKRDSSCHIIRDRFFFFFIGDRCCCCQNKGTARCGIPSLSVDPVT